MDEAMKKLKGASENYQWDLKQIQLQRVNELKKIKETSENMMDEIVSAYKLELEEFK